MHSTLSPAMDASLESKFSAAFEQQAAFNQMMGGNNKSAAAAIAHLLANGFGPQSQLNKLVKQFPANSSTPPPPSSYSHAAQSQPIQSQSLLSSSQQSINQTSSHQTASSTTSTTTTEVNGEKIISFRKEKDLDSFEELSSFVADGLFTDLVICCAGRLFKCHRLVLATSSTYIRDALALLCNNDENSTGPNGTCNHCNSAIFLPEEIKPADVESILRFVYEGHVEVKTAGLESFLRSARTMAIKGLSNIKVAYNQDGGDADLVVGADDEDKSSSGNICRKNEFPRFVNANGMNSPPPSPPNSVNSSLASLKALAQNNSLVSSVLAAAAAGQQQQNGNKSVNGISRSSLKDQSPRPDQMSLLNNVNQQSTTSPRLHFPNGLSFFNSAASQIVPPSSGSRRKAKKFPANISNPLQSGDLTSFTAAALYSQLLNANAASDSELKNEDDDKKFFNNESMSDSDMLSASLSEQVKQAGERLGLPFAQVAQAAAQAAAQQQQQQQGSFPNPACMVEVDADPTIFTNFGDLNENIARLAAAANLGNGLVNSATTPKNKKRKSAKQKSSMESDFTKKIKNPFTSGVSSSPDISMNPASPLMNLGLGGNPIDFAKVKNEPLEMMFNTNQSNQGSNQGPQAGMSPGSGNFAQGFAGQKWKCEYCNKYYGNKQTLKEHMDYFHSNREEQIYICNICKKEYTWRKSLMKHYRDIHQMRNTPTLSEIGRKLVAMSKPSGGSNSNQSQASPASQDNSSAVAAAVSAVAAQSLTNSLDAAQLESLVAQFKNQAAEDQDLKGGDDDHEVDLSMHLEQSMQVCEEAASDEETEVNQSDVIPAESSNVDLCTILSHADDEKTPDSEASGADSAIDATGCDASPGSARSSSASA